jgi:hypothetical protein
MRQKNPWQFHAPTEAQRRAMQVLRDHAQAFAEAIEQNTPECYQRILALQRLEECAVWANKAANQRDD